MGANARPFSSGDAAPRASDFPRAELIIVALYLVLASLWIVLSDRVLEWLAGDAANSFHLQTIKGLKFVLTTALLLYLVLHRSFTRRRRAEAQSREATERFEMVARASTDAIFDWNVNARSIWWSEGLQSLFGYPVEPLGTHIETWSARLHPEERERVIAGFERIFKSTGDMWADEFRFQRKDGSYADVRARAYVMRDTNGTAVRLVGGMSDVTSQRRAEEDLHRSRRQMRALSARLQSLREEERTRIAREIHDELGQMLTGLKMDLRWIERRLGRIENTPAINPILDKAVEAGELADDTIAAVQRISSDLRPGVLDNLGLAAAIRHEAARFQERSGIACPVRLSEVQPALSREAVTGIFRILQEALTNAARHAQATEVQIELRSEAAALALEIVDNGKGFSPPDLASPKSLGLLGMQERAAMIGGTLTFSANSTGGARVTLRLPQNAADTNVWELP